MNFCLKPIFSEHTTQDASTVCPPYIPELSEWLFNAAGFMCMNQIRMTNELSLIDHPSRVSD